MNKTNLNEIIKRFPILDGCKPNITPFRSLEDGEEYAVWLISTERDRYVLKKAKGQEFAVYQAYLMHAPNVPKLYASARYGDDDYILMEYINGAPLQGMTRDQITAAVQGLTSVQEKFWEAEEKDCALSFTQSLAHRTDRGKYLSDATLEAAYERFLVCYKALPRTLCHDDLLPFNIIIGDDKAVLIDWETAGILPYPVPLARLLAHTEETESAFFFMKEEDREFAIDYYYHLLLEKKAIPYSEYRHALALFIFYEYCEWIMLGNKYPDGDLTRFRQYREKALQLAKYILSDEPYLFQHIKLH